MFSPLIVAKGMRKSNEKIENGPALLAVQQRVLKKLREKSKISQFIKNSSNCCICNFCKGGKMWYTKYISAQMEWAAKQTIEHSGWPTGRKNPT